MRNAIAAAALFLPAAALAAGYSLPNTNTRDEAMAGAGVANQNGPEAAFTNGAALAGMEGLSVNLAGTLLFLHADWTDTTGSGLTSSIKGPPVTPVNLSIAYGMKTKGIPWAVGFAFAVPGGGAVEWPSDWPGRASIIMVDRKIFSFDLVGAVQPIEELKLSLGAAYFYGTEHLTQALIFGGMPDGTAELGTSGGALSWSAGLEAKPIKDLPLKIGLQYKHKADMVLKGQAHFDNVPLGLRPQMLDQNATHALTYPNVLNAGVAYDPIKDLTVQAAVTFYRYVVYKDDYFIGDKGLTVHLPFDYTNSVTYRLGAEYGGLLQGALKLRAGVLRDVTPQPTSTIGPALPETSRWAVQVGAGYDISPALTVNVATEYAPFDSVTADPRSEAFQGTYSIRANLICLGVTYRMK